MQDKKIRVAINGAGRIGRAFLRLSQNVPEIELVAINDLGDIENIAYLLKYDTVYGSAQFSISVSEDKTNLLINNKEVKYLSIKEPKELPWKDMNVDVVIEATGAFNSFQKSNAHIEAGAKRVIITAPVKNDESDLSNVQGETILMGISDEKLSACQISSNASCTTNAAAPLIQILNEKIGVEKAILNTIHGYTASQSIVDGPNKKDWKEGRAGAQNIIPTSTGAAIAVAKAVPELEGKFDGLSMRVPIISGSIADVTFIAKRETSVEEINKILKEAAALERWQGIFTVVGDPIVSSDIIGSLFGSIADLGLTRVVDKNLVKVCAWYDNEMGYTATLIKHVLKIGKYL
ncbi:MAG: type I glyceraldehyde-3-phosphate dehydrogenase [Candidatus Zambryskibacteria bacterium RIFOXYC1_FULL_39_10]|uniref:Type I glyceraldehyde-3-phosphate dehydrogenase n=1 Tax=Candidatus Zambryskibacteria bacterium RIFOXYC1_FULL_39_10 TaxID=1802779 RepID=A0A1G2V2J6_9BACT|nr:MAG: type I glyceraldehyde-3-phosphate dehydrogenase [Candidatus Zambryskibacteria bacterium RIFOXYC1_FULL_39_10]OHB16902.1 MAG: type I glyceraldehyde-3-phosphate dehydrogenase [Candidatus Zambryskibacteria bacterium RIFOXYD1_FULL_39_35]